MNKVMLKVLLSLSLFLSSSSIYAKLHLEGLGMHNVEQIYENGGLKLLSQKQHTFVMYNTSRSIKKNSCNFFVSMTNNSSQRETFFVENFIVTDQFGRHIGVRNKRHVLRNQKRRNRSRNFWTSFGHFFETLDTSENAGRKRYREYETTKTGVGVRHSDLYNDSHTSIIAREQTERQGEVHDEAARRAELRALQRQQNEELAALESQNVYDLEKAHYYYLSTHTLLPGETYAANFQLIIPKDIQRDLEYLYFHYTLGDETHTFVYRLR